MELAVAFIMGTAFAAIVAAFAKMIMDLIGKAGHVPDFSSVSIQGISVGAFLSALLSFLLIAAVVYFAVVLPFQTYKQRHATDQPASATSEELLVEIRDPLAQR